MHNHDDELEFNRINREESEKIMDEGSMNLDHYWDKKNSFVVILLSVLGIIIVGGLIYYVFLFLNN